MGNYCFARLDDPESPQENTPHSINTDDNSDTVVRARNASIRHRNLFQEYYLPQYYENDPIFHPTPGVSRPMSQLTEDEQIIIATRLGLLSSLSMFIYDESQKEKYTECIICMCDYTDGEECRHLPCLHTFHKKCIDEWLLRSFTCPSCLERVDTVLLANQSVKCDAKDSGESVCRKRKRRSVSSEQLSRQQSRVLQRSMTENIGGVGLSSHERSNTPTGSVDSNSASHLIINEATGT